ncbi:putative transporter [Colletotrichum sp. SAR 10_98]|nr:putative transporter [Colletotrichum sp. SAR 10_98]
MAQDKPNPEEAGNPLSSSTLIPDSQLEKQVVRKLDLRLASLFATLYFVAYLDRSNIGNAAVAGLTEDLGLSGSQFSTAVSVFFATALIQFFQDIILYGFSTFLPSILRLDLGFTALEAQYLSIPVYFVGGLSFFTAAILGDKWRLRGTSTKFLLGLDVFAVVGYAILLGVANSPGIRYFACYLIAIPLYCGPGLNEIYELMLVVRDQ